MIEPGTPEYLVWVAAIEVARTASKRSAYALVPWRRIRALQAALEAAGVDWRA